MKTDGWRPIGRRGFLDCYCAGAVGCGRGLPVVEVTPSASAEGGGFALQAVGSDVATEFVLHGLSLGFWEGGTPLIARR